MKKLLICILSLMLIIGVLGACTEVEEQEPLGSSYVEYSVTVDGVAKRVLENERVPLYTPSDTEDKIFLYWAVDGQEFSPDTPVNSDLTIVSVWRDREVYTVSFDETVVSVKEGMSAVMPDAPTREGYIFDGWFSGTTEFLGTEAIYENVELVSKWIKKKVEFDYASMDFVSLGNIGGNNAPEFSGGVFRDEQAIHFEFSTTSDLRGTDAMGIFLSVGEITGTARTANTFLVQAFVSGDVKVYNYPDNSKKTLITGRDRLDNGITNRLEVVDGEQVLYVTIPYSFFNGVADELNFSRHDVIGLSMTADNAADSTWDVWSHSELLGIDGNAVVNRINLKDYVRISSNTMLYDYSGNDADTIICGNVGVAGATITIGDKSVKSDSDGSWEIAFLRRDTDNVSVSMSRRGYETMTAEVSFQDKVLKYYDQSVLTTAYGTIIGNVKDYFSGETLAGVEVLYGDQTIETDSQGGFALIDVPLAQSLTISVSGSNYDGVELTYSADEIQTEGFRINAVMINLGAEFTVYGKISNSYEGVRGATLAAGNYTATTDESGEYSMTVSYGDYDLQIIADGYISESKAITKQQLLSCEDSSYGLDVEIVRDYVVWGTGGGSTDVPAVWTISSTRTSTEMRFLATTSSEVDMTVNNGPSVFLQLGERNSNVRNAKTINVTMYTTCEVSCFYYPNNSKKSITLKGIDISAEKVDGVTSINCTIPYATLAAYEQLDALSDIGLSLTFDCGSKYTIFSHATLYGKDKSLNVDRFNPWDYMTWTKDNELKDYDVTEEELNSRVANIFGDNKTLFDNMAEFSINNNTATLATVRSDAKLFSDRNYKFTGQEPSAITGKQYTLSGIDKGPDVTITMSGYMLMMVPDNGTYTSLNKTVLAAGWTPVLSKYNKNTDVQTFYVKWCEVGETFSYGKWNIYITNSAE